MTSYLRSWLYGGTVEAEPTPTIETTSPQASDDEDASTEKGNNDNDDDEDDSPPAFPSLNSAQRASSSSSALPRVLTDSQLMPPPPLPSLASRRPGVPSTSTSTSLAVPAAARNSASGSTLALPPSTTKPPPKPSKKKGKVALAPGHSALDWAALKSSGADLRGVDTLMRIPPSVLKQHNKRDDAWSSFYGKVYNITPYIPFHPGGEKELLRVAGRDGTKLFATTHGWVNIDFMLDSSLVGFLVSESAADSS